MNSIEQEKFIKTINYSKDIPKRSFSFIIKQSKKNIKAKKKCIIDLLNGLNFKNFSLNFYLIFLFLIVFISMFSQIFTSQKAKLRELVDDNYITLTIEGTGEHTIINAGYQSSISSIKINNGAEITESINIIQNLVETTNTIIITFSSPLSSLNSMFKNLEDIILVDLTHLDFSLVIDMESIFGGCSSLKSVDFSNKDASLVKNMKICF